MDSQSELNRVQFSQTYSRSDSKLPCLGTIAQVLCPVQWVRFKVPQQQKCPPYINNIGKYTEESTVTHIEQFTIR